MTHGPRVRLPSSVLVSDRARGDAEKPVDPWPYGVFIRLIPSRRRFENEPFGEHLTRQLIWPEVGVRNQPLGCSRKNLLCHRSRWARKRPGFVLCGEFDCQSGGQGGGRHRRHDVGLSVAMRCGDAPGDSILSRRRFLANLGVDFTAQVVLDNLVKVLVVHELGE